MTRPGYHGRFLSFDLGAGRGRAEPLPDEALRRFVGGVGLGTWLLARSAAPRTDALAPEAPFVVALSPLVGSPLTTSAKFAVVAKSPLTDRLCDALASDRFAIELKACGLDALVLAGRCADWSILVVTGDGARLEPAADLLGLSAEAAEERVRARLGEAYRWFGIGPAGERLVRYATVSGAGRHAGRGGLGAVLGSKRLKGIAVHGTLRTELADAARVLALAKDLAARSLGPATAKYRELGTVSNLLVLNRLSALPTRNFRSGSFEGAERVSGEAFAALPSVRRHCAACTVGCEHVFQGPDGTQARLEYESLFALGPLCGIDDRDAVLAAAARCDALGLDVISAGGTAAFAMECRERGLLPDAPRFGDGPGLLRLLDDVATRTGLGDLLAEGSRRAAARIGSPAPEFANHVKGLELPGYEPRAMKSMAVGLATASRGADHNRSGAYEEDFRPGTDRLAADAGKGAAAAAAEVRAAVLDSLILCKFLRGALRDPFAEPAEMLAAVTGFPYDAAEVERLGRRVVTARKLWNVQEGWTAAEDTLPARLLGAPQEGAPPRHSLSRDDLGRMIASYYRAHGWTEGGEVPQACAAALGLGDLLVREGVPR